MTNLKIYKIHPNAVLPKHATQQAACFDISACGDTIVPAHHTIAILTGIIGANRILKNNNLDPWNVNIDAEYHESKNSV
jgi:hypothetical protein